MPGQEAREEPRRRQNRGALLKKCQANDKRRCRSPGTKLASRDNRRGPSSHPNPKARPGHLHHLHNQD